MNQTQKQETVSQLNGTRSLVGDTQRTVSAVARQLQETVEAQVRQINRVIADAEGNLGQAKGDGYRALRRLIDDMITLKGRLSGVSSDDLLRVGHKLTGVGTSLEKSAAAVSKIDPTE